MSDQLTEHFKRSEFACRCGCGYDAISLQLVSRLQMLRHAIGRPIHVNSGCRCSKHNKAVRGERSSYHLEGKAADIWVDKMSAAELSRLADRSGWFNGLGTYPTFVHVDVRPLRYRWNGDV